MADDERRILALLHIYTAISLNSPTWDNELSRRYVEPLAERLFGGHPELSCVEPLRRDELPKNIQVTEFYFQPGRFLDSLLAQQNYLSSNYTHAVRDLLNAGINVLAQAVSAKKVNGRKRYSLSCNTDLTLDIMPHLRRRRRQGRKIAFLAQVNRNLPFMYGDAVVEAGYFDARLDAPEYEFPLFAVPNRPVATSDYIIGLYASALIQDGGTLQIGIGSLGDAVVSLLTLRHRQNDRYRALLEDSQARRKYQNIINDVGGTDSFKDGLYASSEMLLQGFLRLHHEDVLKRKVYDHAGVQRLLNEERITEEVTPEMLAVFYEEDLITSPITAEQVRDLQTLGILRPELCFDNGTLILEDGTRVPADLENADARAQIEERCLGDELTGGHVAHRCFFLGSTGVYEALRALQPTDRREISMTGISFVNELYG